MFGIEGALIAVGALLPAFALLRWAGLRRLEIGAPVESAHYRLLREQGIFAPLPIDVVERLTRHLVPVRVAAGEEVITQGEQGDRFYLIAEGEVAVLQGKQLLRTQGRGEAFGEIALLKQVPRTATVRSTCECRFLALDRDHFVAAVTGHLRSHEAAEAVTERWLAAKPSG